MQLRLRTKLTLVMTGLVLLVVAAVCTVIVAQLLDQILQETDKRAAETADQAFQQAKRALIDATHEGLRPESASEKDVHDYVRRAFEIDEGLHAQLNAAKRTFSIYEVSITDQEGMVLVSTDESMPGKFVPRRTPLSQLTQRGLLHAVKILGGPPKIYEFDFPFNNADKPFGEVRVAISSGLLVTDL